MVMIEEKKNPIVRMDGIYVMYCIICSLELEKSRGKNKDMK